MQSIEFVEKITFGCSSACAGVEFDGKCSEMGSQCELSGLKWFLV